MRRVSGGPGTPAGLPSGQNGLGQLGQLPQPTLQIGRRRLTIGTHSSELRLQVAYSRPQECHLVDETTIRNSSDVAEKGLRHLVGLHTRRFGGSWEGHASRGSAPVRASLIGSHGRAGRSTFLVAARVHGALTLCEPGDPAVCFGPSLDYRPYPPRRTWAVQGIEQCLDGRTRSLGDDFDPAVVQVRRPADQPEFEGPCPHPPAKSDTLYVPVHPCRQTDIGRSLYRVRRQFPFSPPAHRPHQRPFRGRGWQRGQLNDERFMNGSRRIGVPQRGQGSSCRPYTCRERSK